jgi:lysophospholipase L1-like esterase
MQDGSPRYGALAGKTVRTLTVMLAALAVPYASPQLRALRVIDAPWDRAPAAKASAAMGGSIAPVLTALTAGEQTLAPSENTPTVTNALPAYDGAIDPGLADYVHDVPIEDPTGHALDAFYASLARTDKKELGAVTRILHYGDSTIASDYVSGTMRRRFQSRFGDAGHGFILIANPWEWYFHNDVSHASQGEWKASRLSGPIAPDGMYGLGGVSFTSYGGGIAWYGTATKGDFGRKVSRFDLYYLEQPGGGDVELSIKGGATERFSTRAEQKATRVRSMTVPDGEAELRLRAVGGGGVRLFGVSLERDVPGVTYDALGAHAAMAVYWKQQNAAHWKEQMDLRRPALVVFQYGTNESDLWKFDETEYEKGLGEVLDVLRAASPGASIVVAAPMDRAEASRGKVVTKAVIPKLVSIQRRVALARGMAVWSMFDAMGGEGSMARWYKARPQLAGGDLTHPTPLGAELLGNAFTKALLAKYGP